MYGDNLGENQVGQPQGRNLGVDAAVGREQPQSIDGRMNGEEEKVSPDDSGSPLDRKFNVSPMGTLDRGRK